MPERNAGPIGWYLVGLAATMAAGFIWLGNLTNQITVNTGRLDRLENFANEVRQHDADTTARIGPMERRMEQLENWQQAIKRGDTR